MLIYSFIADYQAFSLRYKDNTTRDKNETKVGKQSANLGKNNEPIQNRLSLLIDCKSVILHHLTILSFPMVRPAWDNWWILQMCMALAALFSIVVAGSMAYKMMVKHEPIDIMKLFKPLVVSVILCWWYPPADTGITNNGSSWCVLDFLSYIPNCIGSYTHDLYEAESAQIEDKFEEVQELIYTRDTLYNSLQAQADVAHSGTSDPNLIESTMEQAGVDEVTNMETDASKLWFTSLTAGAVVGIDKVIMLIALIVFRIGWWATIYCQQILLGMLTIFGPIQWAFSLLPKWEGAWAKWLIRYLTVHFYGAMLYFVGYFYNLTRSISDRLYLYISHVQQTCTKITIKKSNEGGARAYWQVRIEKMNVFLFRLSSHLSLFWSYFLSNFCLRISLCFGLIIWHEAAMFDIFSNRR